MSIELRNVIPSGSTLTLAKGIASFFALSLVNGAELVLTKYSEGFAVLWSKLIGTYGVGSIPVGNYTIMEDEQAFIHVVGAFAGVFEPHFKEIIDDRFNTLIVRLSEQGSVISIKRSSTISFDLVKIVNDVWMVFHEISNISCYQIIQIKNLTTSSYITTLVCNGNIALSYTFFIEDKLFIAGAANGNIIYRGKTITINKPSGILVIIDTLTWDLIDYFIVSSAVENATMCEENDERCHNSSYISSVAVNIRGVIYIAGYSKGRGIDIYQRDVKIASAVLDYDNNMILARITYNKSKTKVRLVHFPFGGHLLSSNQLLNMVKDDHIILIGNVRGFILLKHFNIDVSRLSTRNTYMIRFSKKLDFHSIKIIGSGTLVPMTSKDCDCSDCPGDDNCRYIPCRITRLFPLGSETAAGNSGKTCSGYSGFSCVTNSGFPGAPCFYTCFEGNGHCLAKPNGGQLGDLYNTKYSINVTIPQTQSITQANTMYFMEEGNKIAINNVSNIILSGTFIENLMINGSIEKTLYKQKWSTFLLDFNYS